MRSFALRTAKMVGAHPRMMDSAFAITLAGYTIVWGTHFTPVGTRPFDLAAVALTTMANLPVAVRRRVPFTVLLVCGTGSVIYVAQGYWGSLNGLGLMLATYSVAAYRTPRVAAVGAAFSLAFMQYGLMSLHIGPAWTLIGQSLTLSGAPWAIGNGTRLLHSRNERLQVLTLQLEAEQGARARRAVTTERVRIAQELHDVVAHHMSVISIQASLARYVFDSDPGTARAALRTVEETSHEALEETRRLLSILRPATQDPADGVDLVGDADLADHNQPYAPAPGLDRLDDVLERVRAAGVPVTLTVTGTRRTLPPGVDLCAYRVVQEALTNILKHARPAGATVLLDYQARHLSLHILDDGGRPATADRGQTTTGQGLNGMRERARLYGGSLTAGRRTDGGFEVHLLLPIPTAVATDHPTALETTADPAASDGR